MHNLCEHRITCLCKTINGGIVSTPHEAIELLLKKVLEPLHRFRYEGSGGGGGDIYDALSSFLPYDALSPSAHCRGIRYMPLMSQPECHLHELITYAGL